MSKITVHLHGYFKTFSDGPITVVANTIAEALDLVTRQIKGFEPNAIRGRHRATVVGCDRYEDLMKSVDDTDVHLFPQLAGGKKGGFWNIVIGAILIAASFLLPSPFSGILFNIGAALVLGGVASLFAPAPDATDTNESKYLGPAKNTVRSGTRIPILYGTCKSYGHILSCIIKAKNSHA